MNPIEFPINSLLPRIGDSLAVHPRLVLEAPPGAGKTTQVPLALLDAPWLAGRKVVLLEPRRVAARAAAGFMARQLGEELGATVGYRIRFESKVSARTRIEVVTEGILTRMIQDDPTLEGIGALLFDEFHERHLSSDLGLALALDVQSQLRDDLRIVAMSATLDGERLANFLDAPRLSSAGRSFPVVIEHFPARRVRRQAFPEQRRGAQDDRLEPLSSHVRRAVEHALATHPGDVLVFLPGQREIAQVQKALAALGPSPDGRGVGVRGWPSEATQVRRALADYLPPPRAGEGWGGGTESKIRFGARLSESPSSGATHHLLPEGKGDILCHVLPLHGELPIDAQTAVLAPHDPGERRVVLATNIAESSVTLPGVRVVIDAGLAREPRYDPNSGFSRLETVAISQASADQRVGRAGRVAEGFAYRLWPQSQRLEPQRRAEIAQVELSGLALELAAWGSSELRFLDPPPPGALAAARDLLQRLGALEDRHTITPFGRQMLALGTHPRLAAMLLAPDDEGERVLACDLAALIEARDPLRSRSDALAERWQALAQFRGGRIGADTSRHALAAIDQAARQWRRRLRIDIEPLREVSAYRLGDLLAHAYPDRIAHQTANDPRRYQLANGRSANLFDDSAVFGQPWLVVVELQGGQGRQAQILRAVPLDERRLERDFSDRFVSADRTYWDATRRAILAVRERRFDAIVLESKPLSRPDPQRCADALLEAVRELGLAVLPWSDALTQWRTRVRCLRAWLAPSSNFDHGLPDLSDAALLAALDDWLRPALVGLSRLDAIDENAFADALKSCMDWSARQRLDALAPPRIVVPSGLERAIEYGFDDAADAPQAPVLAVKLQELFGLADTPRIAQGRVPLTLHLLSPGGKPLQVTQDLRGFWDRTYPEVRKEMKGRYPRHPWPDDPWSAVATHRAKPRGT